MRRPAPGARAPSPSPATPPASRWGGRLFLAPGLVLYVGDGASADVHAHHAVQLVWARDGDLTVQLDGRTVDAGAALVPAGVEHGFEAPGRTIALLLLEPHGPRGAALEARARTRAPDGDDLVVRLREVGFPALDLDADAAVAWCDAVLAALGAGAGPRPPPSRASRRAVAYVEGALDGAPRLEEAARLTRLSPTRLTHRFTTEVGIPFRRFVLWARLKRAIEATRRGASATAAAVEAGFSDSAHLSRTFRAMFGLPPSLLLPHVEIVGSVWAAPLPARADRNVQARPGQGG